MGNGKRWSQASAENQTFVIGRLKTELIDLKKDHAGLAGPALEVGQGREEAVELAIEALYLARVDGSAGPDADVGVLDVGPAEVVAAAEVVDEIRALPSNHPEHGLVSPVANFVPQLPHAGHPARASFGAHPGLIAHVPFGAATALAAPGEGGRAVPTRDVRVLDDEGRVLVKTGDVVRNKHTAVQGIILSLTPKFAQLDKGGFVKLTDLERV